MIDRGIIPQQSWRLARVAAFSSPTFQPNGIIPDESHPAVIKGADENFLITNMAMMERQPASQPRPRVAFSPRDPRLPFPGAPNVD